MIGFWIGLGIVGVMALTALRPPQRPGWLREAGYHAGWVINEVPLFWLLLILASVWLTLDEHGWELVDGQLLAGLVVAAGLSGLLVYLQARSRGVRKVFDDALKETMGWGLPSRSRSSVLAQNLRAIVLPMPRRRRGVRHLRNIAYGEHGYRNLLDVYLPPAKTPVGVFVHFHGGHFRIGRKNTQSLPLLYDLARQGWICVSANYRLQPKSSFPDYVIDAKRAVAWATRYAAELGADPDLVVASGDSAGANLALFCGATPGDTRFQPGFEDDHTHVAAVVALYGYYGPSSGDPASSPLVHVNAELPPVLMVHGGLDTSAPVAWARNAVTKMRKAAVNPVVYIEPRDTQHTFDYFRSPRCNALIETTISFLSWVRNSGVPA